MRTTVVLFTRDLRVHDNPALAAAAREADCVVPLFVRDEAIAGTPNRLAFLHESLRDLDRSLRERGAALVFRRGDTAAEVARVVRETGAEAVHASRDVSAHAERRESRLAGTVPLRLHDGITVVPADELHPYRVFAPYFRAWRGVPARGVASPPERLALPGGLEPGELGDPPRAESAGFAPGGERAGRARMAAWLRGGISSYGERQRLDLDATSRLSPYLHFGCVSPLELVQGAAGAEAFIREVAWRDFYAQLLLHEGAGPLHDRGDTWDGDPALLDAWRAGETGYPVVDAGMRQLRGEGWMHNRARLITASFLTKHLYLDWRLGARHFFDLLVDGDTANNIGNWQWVAGVGTDTRPYRVYNPTLQGKRHDPAGEYVRRWVPELRGLAPDEIHEPWLLPAARWRGYPAPVVEHIEAVRRFRDRRSGQLTLT